MQKRHRLIVLFVSIVLIVGMQHGHAQPFQTAFRLMEGDMPLGLYRGFAAWGDVGADGDLDVFLSGNLMEAYGSSQLLRQAGPFFAEYIGLPQVQFSSIDLGDFDRDGHLDVLVTGRLNNDRPLTGVYKATTDVETNERMTFEIAESFYGLIPVERGDAIWGDYDNDGDLDILLTGAARYGFVSKIYRNDGLLGRQSTGSVFTEMQVDLTGVAESAVLWEDFDHDGDLDILLSGNTMTGFVTKIYRNDGPSFTDAWQFTEVQTDLPGLAYGDVTAADYDADGDVDLLLSGCLDDDCATSLTAVYRNNGTTSDRFAFEAIPQSFPGAFRSSVSWGDYDNDGDLDFILTGEDSANPGVSRTTIYRHEAAFFVEAEDDLPGVTDGTAQWGDYDRDGKLDILLMGYCYEEERFLFEIYHNESSRRNTRPEAPSNVGVTILDESTATITWDPGTDLETSQAGLTYNLRVCTGSFDGSRCTGDVVSSMALRSDGQENEFRQIVRFGNMGTRREWTLNRLAPGDTYLVSVQTVDQSYEGSLFSPEVAFTLPGENDNFLASLTVTDETSLTTIYFGSNTFASDGFETTFDYLAGPRTPGNTFEARFVHSDIELLKDIRGTNQDSIVWNIYARPWYNNRLTFFWDPDDLPDGGSLRFRDGLTHGGFVDVDMQQTNTAPIELYLTTFEIIYQIDPAKGHIATGVSDLPSSFKFYGNYPNPAVSYTNLLMDLPARTELHVEIYDVLGRRVANQPWQDEDAGRNRIVRVNTGALSSGAYVYRVFFRNNNLSHHTASGRLVVLRD